MNLFHYSGIGDWLQVSSYFTEAEIGSLSKIVWASKAEPILRPVLEASQSFGHVEHETLWPEREHHFTRWDDVPLEILRTHTSRYHSILGRRRYRGCPLLAETLTDALPELPERFAYIQPTTPHNHTSRIGQPYRDMQPDEWGAVLRWLDKNGLVGVVCNSRGGMAVPQDKRLLDLTGQTTLAQAIEVLKLASGYIGIDSWASILASQILPAESLMIRTQNKVISSNPWCFYSPHKTFPFLVPVLGGPAYPVAPRCLPCLTNRFVMLTEETYHGGSVLRRGQVLEVSPRTRDRMIDVGLGLEVFEGEQWESPEEAVDCLKVKLLTRWATAYFNHPEGTVLNVTKDVADSLIGSRTATHWEDF